MITTLIPYYELQEMIADDTGITNLSNLSEKIRRWVFRAEQQIGYGGAQVLKRINYTKDDLNFTGKKLFLPSDCLELDEVYIDGAYINNTNYRMYGNFLNFNGDHGDAQKAHITYQAIMHDSEGNPAVPRSHAEAIMHYVIWKLAQAKSFLESNKVSRNLVLSYRQEWYDTRDAAQGNDAFMGNLEDWEIFNTIRNMSSMEAYIYYPRATENNAILESKEHCVLKQREMNVRTFSWQYSDLTTNISDHVNVDLGFLEGQTTEYSFQNAREGVVYPYNAIGRIAFALQDVEDGQYRIFDTFNSDVTDLVFDIEYHAEERLQIYVSKTFYTHSNIFFKIKEA